MKIEDTGINHTLRPDYFREFIIEGFRIHWWNAIYGKIPKLYSALYPGATEYLPHPFPEPCGRGHQPPMSNHLKEQIFCKTQSVTFRGAPAQTGKQDILTDTARTGSHTGSTKKA